MKYRFQPKNRDELYNFIKEIVTNQENNKNYFYGLKNIDVSLINDMSYLFSCFEDDKNSEINRKINWNDPRNDIALWNVNNVTNMSEMFYESHFNQDIRNWDVSHVTSMSNMFAYSDFNQDISHWNVNNITNMYQMFANSPFEHNLYKWRGKLNKQVYLLLFNNNSNHEKIFGSINNINDFIENQLTPPIWLQWYKESNDREQFELLKLLKHRNKHFIKTLNQLLKKDMITIDI